MKIAYFLALAVLVLPNSNARAWDKHQTLMPGIFQAPRVAQALARDFQAPCPADDQAQYEKLAGEVQLNPRAKVLPTSPEACARKVPIKALDILNSFVVDEPDFGMDEDLPGPPEGYDPNQVQKWMGGTSGPTSKGFRHMYFGGWQLWHPLATFQIPPGAIGYAPLRAGLLALKARELIRAGGVQAAWGVRVLGWAIHYVQDLSQPFHAVQIPSLDMVPWYALIQWPPSAGFDNLVHETTRTIANYHWAYEDYIRVRLTEERSSLTECLADPDLHSLMGEDPRKEEAIHDPLILARRIARASVRIAPKIGDANMRFFGPGLKDHGIDLPRNQGTPNYAEMTLRPDLTDQREELREVSCIALANASWATRTMIEWVLAPL